MEVNDAISIAAEAFPSGVEELASRMGVQVERSPLKGCEGWCVSRGDRHLVRINAESSPERQRFTLAHELSHILLFSTPDVSTGTLREEQEVNVIAACLLLPKEKLHELAGVHRPVQRAALERISRTANVSLMMVTRRVVTMASDLGVAPAFVADERGGRIRWTFPRNACPESRSLQLIDSAKKSGGSMGYNWRGNEFVADIFETQWSTTLLVQRCV